MTDEKELKQKLARLMLYVGDVDDVELRIAMESTLQDAHSVLSDDRDGLYRYTEGETDG